MVLVIKDSVYCMHACAKSLYISSSVQTSNSSPLSLPLTHTHTHTNTQDKFLVPCSPHTHTNKGQIIAYTWSIVDWKAHIYNNVIHIFIEKICLDVIYIDLERYRIYVFVSSELDFLFLYCIRFMIDYNYISFPPHTSKMHT